MYSEMSHLNDCYDSADHSAYAPTNGRCLVPF